MASKEKSAYVAAKHAVVGLTKTVALETARSGITCNAICPGWVLTRWCSSRSTNASPRGRPEQASAQLLAENSPPGSLSPRSSWAKWRCFYAATPPPVRGAAWNMDGGWVAQ
nr:D-beta-hydroxybutyrate dehydrogenase [Klebsiella pneumoniae]